MNIFLFYLKTHRIEPKLVDLSKCCSCAIKCRFAGFHLTEQGFQYLSTESPELSLKLINCLCTFLVSNGKCEEALRFLPSSAMNFFLNQVIKSKEFCSLLAARRPDWIQSIFASKKEFLLEHACLFKAFHGIDSMYEYFKNVSFQEKLSVARLVFLDSSIAEISEFLKGVETFFLKRFYDVFFSTHLKSDRFVEISIIFASFESFKSASIEGNFFELSSEDFFEILKKGELLAEIYDCSFKTEYFLKSRLLSRMLHSDELRPKLMAANPSLLTLFQENESTCVLSYTPTTIYYAYQFFHMDRFEYLRWVLKTIERRHQGEYEIRYPLENVVYLVLFIALSRAWYSADPSIYTYSGPHKSIKKFLKNINEEDVEVCQNIISSLSDAAKASLEFVFVEMEKIKLEMGI